MYRMKDMFCTINMAKSKVATLPELLPIHKRHSDAVERDVKMGGTRILYDLNTPQDEPEENANCDVRNHTHQVIICGFSLLVLALAFYAS